MIEKGAALRRWKRAPLMFFGGMNVKLKCMVLLLALILVTGSAALAEVYHSSDEN